jgi:ankyrin repeat protein
VEQAFYGRRAQTSKESDVTSETDKLFNAVKCGSLDQSERAIEAGADINAQDEWRRTPLSYAAGNGYTPIATLLIQKRAALDIKDVHELTARDWAERVGAPSIVSLIDEAGVRQAVHAEQLVQRRDQSGRREVD